MIGLPPHGDLTFATAVDQGVCRADIGVAAFASADLVENAFAAGQIVGAGLQKQFPIGTVLDGRPLLLGEFTHFWVNLPTCGHNVSSFNYPPARVLQLHAAFGVPWLRGRFVLGL